MAAEERKTAMIRARMQPDLKAKAEAMLEELGLSPSTAINLFYRQIVAHGGLPFEVKLPNSKTRKSMRDAQAGRGLIRGGTIDELFETLDADAE